ncbi:hypothetical protein ACHMWU_22725 [Aeromicrobium sp. UC242_57]
MGLAVLLLSLRRGGGLAVRAAAGSKGETDGEEQGGRDKCTLHG